MVGTLAPSSWQLNGHQDIAALLSNDMLLLCRRKRSLLISTTVEDSFLIDVRAAPLSSLLASVQNRDNGGFGD
jgi:hypothetical protein